MSDTMDGAVIFVCFMAWLSCGGWAFARFMKDSDDAPVGPLMIFCLIVAPFAAGAAYVWTSTSKPKINQIKEG